MAVATLDGMPVHQRKIPVISSKYAFDCIPNNVKSSQVGLHCRVTHTEIYSGTQCGSPRTTVQQAHGEGGWGCMYTITALKHRINMNRMWFVKKQEYSSRKLLSVHNTQYVNYSMYHKKKCSNIIHNIVCYNTLNI